jgi:hypothetical protein
MGRIVLEDYTPCVTGVTMAQGLTRRLDDHVI